MRSLRSMCGVSQKDRRVISNMFILLLSQSNISQGGGGSVGQERRLEVPGSNLTICGLTDEFLLKSN
ncbi:hypothetical protein EVAR_93017_1 [Eumeta japonica]|uniref:Uncharacterized protein n=1 Tax=Eumeta variegata TaxID=151549 RepID=A0A4C1SGZ7_EUMVA|nr:hypothetical protein EVAR_93017_1 [Eumeta japonica]